MASEKKQNENVPVNKLNEVANENYKTLSDEFVKSMQQHVQAISDNKLMHDVRRIGSGKAIPDVSDRI